MELLILFVIIAFIIVATLKFKMHPVFSLTIAALAAGFSFGLAPDEIMTVMSGGFGKTLSGIGLVIAFGTIIGIFLEKTGGTKVLANTILHAIGMKRSPLALNLAGFVISIPVFCDSGFVILSSLNKTLSDKTKIPKLVFAIALATGLYSAHVFVPPTPGPLAAAAILEADLGMVMLLGPLVAVPVSLTGYQWAKFMGNRLKENHEQVTPEKETGEAVFNGQVSTIKAFLPLLVPVVLIALKSIAEYPTHPLGEGMLFTIMVFIGNPIVALLVGVFLSFPLAQGVDLKTKNTWIVDALKQAGLIVLITGAGGAFGAILRTLDIASILNLDSSSQHGGLVLCFVIAAVLKTSQGSSTVAIITTAAIIAPLLSVFGLISIPEKALAVLAVGAGAMTVSHINDSYFWVVSQFSNMNMESALKGHTLATLFQGLVAISVILLLNLLL
ncbi:GntP family permease [Croceitalea sp. MTPC5]|uniref:GntP family permease n=1 Tax=Croceitalea sp. MTPC5 TaxID=3056565 RepID=UPI002B3FE713|nr:GntP family permease [Croceitalea sp. MTPC5]